MIRDRMERQNKESEEISKEKKTTQSHKDDQKHPKKDTKRRNKRTNISRQISRKKSPDTLGTVSTSSNDAADVDIPSIVFTHSLKQIVKLTTVLL